MQSFSYFLNLIQLSILYWKLIISMVYPIFLQYSLQTRKCEKNVCKLLFLTLNAVEFYHHFIALYIFITNLFLDVKMNHVRGAVSIRNMAQGSDPSSIGKYENIIIIICILS